MNAPAVLALVLVAAGAALFVYGAFLVRTAIASRGWPLVHAQIIRSDIEVTQSWAMDAAYDQEIFKPVLRYRYSVQGTSYEGEWIAFGLRNLYGSHAFARKYLQRYPLNRQVQVHYNTQDPAQSVLEAGLSARALVYFVGSLIFIGFGVFVWRVFGT